MIIDTEQLQPGSVIVNIRKILIAHALEKNEGNRTAAARWLGINRRTLYQRKKKTAATDQNSR